MREIWNWIQDRRNQSAMRLVGAALASVAVAIWTAFTFFMSSDEEPAPPPPPPLADLVLEVTEVRQARSPSVEKSHSGRGGDCSEWLPIGPSEPGWRVRANTVRTVREFARSTGNGGTEFLKINLELTPESAKICAYAQPTSRHHEARIRGHAVFDEERNVEARAVITPQKRTHKFPLSSSAIDVTLFVTYADGIERRFKSTGSDDRIEVEVDLRKRQVVVNARSAYFDNGSEDQ